MKTEVDKIDINKLINVPTSSNNFKTYVDDLDDAELKTVLTDLKKVSDAVKNGIVKKTNLYTLKTKVNELDNKIPDAIPLIHINQYYSNIQNLEKNIGNVDKIIADISGLVITTVLNTKINEVKNKIPVVSDLGKKTSYSDEILEIEGKYFTISGYNKFTSDIRDAKIKQK